MTARYAKSRLPLRGAFGILNGAFERVGAGEILSCSSQLRLVGRCHLLRWSWQPISVEVKVRETGEGKQNRDSETFRLAMNSMRSRQGAGSWTPSCTDWLIKLCIVDQPARLHTGKTTSVISSQQTISINYRILEEQVK